MVQKSVEIWSRTPDAYHELFFLPKREVLSKIKGKSKEDGPVRDIAGSILVG